MWLLIDGNNWFHIAWHGAGESCVESFFGRIQALKANRFERVVVAFDKGRSWRYERYPAYKSNRSEKPEGFEEMFSQAKDLVSAYHEVVEEDGMEADDLLGELCRDAIDEGVKSVVASSDKDLHQCITEGLISQCTKVQTNMGDPTCQFVTAKSLKERYGVEPWQWVDYRALIGDSSDCIKGCHKVGPKAASTVFANWSSLEDFREDPERAKLGKVTRQRLIEFIDDDENGLKLHREIMRLGSREDIGKVEF